MALREDLLNPISAANPSGAYLRYDAVYDKLKEARREEEDLAQGVWQHERKVADWAQVMKLGQEILATQTKDLQVAAWLTEALVKKEGFAGLRSGLDLCRGFIEKFWDSMYPPVEDGDLADRSTPLEWVGSTLDLPVRSVPLNREGHDWLKYTDSRKVGYDDPKATAEQKKAREALLKAGKLPPEAFDKAFAETPKAFYAQAEKDLDGCLATVDSLQKVCDGKFGSEGPGFSKLKAALGEVRHTVHALLEKKRETEPDPVVAEPPPAVEAAPEAGASAAQPTAPGAGLAALVIPLADSEAPDRREAVAAVSKAAAFLRKKDPSSPAPYLMMRGLRWGELRAAAVQSDPTKLEAPPTEVRQHLKRLALDKKWLELLEAAESVMALPCSRAWLDLQRLVAEACAGLGNEYNAVAIAIQSELKALLRDLPQLLEANLLDDTPAANTETRTWLRQLLAEPAAATPDSSPPANPVVEDDSRPGWQRKFVDSYTLATEAARAGQVEKAVEIMNKEIARQRSGRGRFLRKLQLAQLCASAGKEAIAQPILDDLAATVETHKLDDWEDRQLVASALATIMKLSKKIQGDAKAKQAMFERICRLDPAQALNC